MNEKKCKHWYERLTQSFLRSNYTDTDEYKILREYLAYPSNQTISAQFTTYNTYVEECKEKAKLCVPGMEPELDQITEPEITETGLEEKNKVYKQ